MKEGDLPGQFKDQGVVFSTIPENVYPGMRYIRVSEIASTDAIPYSAAYLYRLIKRLDVPILELAGRKVLEASAVNRILEHLREKAINASGGQIAGRRKLNEDKSRKLRMDLVSDWERDSLIGSSNWHSEREDSESHNWGPYGLRAEIDATPIQEWDKTEPGSESN